MEIDYELAELVQQAFDKYIADKMPALAEKHLPLVDKLIENRINGNYTPEVNKTFFDRISSIVDAEVGGYLRVGKGRDIIDTTVFKYLDKKLEQHIEDQVQWRLKKVLEKLGKQFAETTKV